MKLKVNKLETKLQATEVEIYIINKVMEYRVAANYSKTRLSLELRLSGAYVRKIENPSCKEKYNVNLLNEAAKILGCRMADFMPVLPVPYVCYSGLQRFLLQICLISWKTAYRFTSFVSVQASYLPFVLL